MYKENKDITLQYYNQNAGSFVSGTVHADLTDTLNRFLSRLEPGAAILDFGCGSGRDTKYFLEHGYQVEAIDGSEELCKIASAYTGIPVRQMYFQDLDVREQYDGIWACSSILHLEKTEIKNSVLKKNGGMPCVPMDGSILLSNMESVKGCETADISRISPGTVSRDSFVILSHFP